MVKRKNIKFQAVDVNAGVNVTKSSAALEFVKLLSGLLIFISILYFFAGSLISFIVPHISTEYEAKIWDFVDTQENTSNAKHIYQERLNKVMAQIPSSTLAELPNYPYNVIAVESDIANAVALPGGRILVYSGLMDLIKDDQTLLFVIGHELGHYASRDHLNMFGREIILSLIKSFLGMDSPIFTHPQDLLSKGYSRQQEAKADLWGYRILKDSGGSKKHALQLFKILQSVEEGDHNLINVPMEILRTHPFPQDRADFLRDLN